MGRSSEERNIDEPIFDDLGSKSAAKGTANSRKNPPAAKGAIETVKRRNRRIQHRDQLNQWGSNDGRCFRAISHSRFL